MVYLLKWLISLITPHTHDKEGKQGNSFIVRKALGNRASFSSLASKKGSSLLLVVMTMSVIIVISSSFMLLSFNTGIGSIFASSQQKAQLSCLSVAEGLKDGNTFAKVYEYYNISSLNDGEEVFFVANNQGLSGKTEVTLTRLMAGKKVLVTVNTVVGSSNYTLKFTHELKSNSVRDVINQVVNPMSVSGGGSFSLETGTIFGDLSLDGDYLLALRGYYESKKQAVTGKWGSVFYPGMVDGSVYCDGSLVLGYKGNSIKVYESYPEDLLGGFSQEKKFSTAIATVITGNLYVNGDLIINACEIQGDVYVSGNVLVNGVTPVIRGKVVDDAEKHNLDYETGKSNAVIKGNLYIGGNFYATVGSFERYYPDQERIKDNKNKNIHSGGYTFNKGFPLFPTETEIKSGRVTYEDYCGRAGLDVSEYKTSKDRYLDPEKGEGPRDVDGNGYEYYGLTKAIVGDAEEVKNEYGYREYKYTFSDGTSEVLSGNFLKDTSYGVLNFETGNIEEGKTLNDVDGSSNSYDKYHVDNDDKYSVVEVKDYNGTKCIVVNGWDAFGWYKKKGEYKKTGKDTQAYNHFMDLAAGVYWNAWEDSITKESEGYTFRGTLIKNYERNAISAACGKANMETDSLYLSLLTKTGEEKHESLSVNGNVYVQNSVLVQFGSQKLGRNTYVGQNVDIYKISQFCKSDNTVENVSYETEVFSKLSYGGVKVEHELYASKFIQPEKNYYYAQMALSGRNTETYSEENAKTPYPKEWTHAFYYNSSYIEFKIEGNQQEYFKNTKNIRDHFKSENIGGGSGENLCQDKKTTRVSGLMAYGTYAMYETTKSVKNTNASFDIYGLSVKEDMYFEKFLDSHNGTEDNPNYSLAPEQIRAEEVENVGDVLKEMGVYKYNAEEIRRREYQNAYTSDTYYVNLAKTNKTNLTDVYEEGKDNKLNDPSGINFTGVTSATQIKFGYTIQKAIYETDRKKTITVRSKGVIGGTVYTGSNLEDVYKNNSTGTVIVDKKSYNRSETLYGRLLYLGTTDITKVKESLKQLNENKNSEGSKLSQYAGVYGKIGNNFCIYFMKDIVFCDSYFGFGDGDEKNLRMYADVSYGNINIYWGGDQNAVLNFGENSYIETSMLLANEKDVFNVAYMYIIPNISYSDNVATLKNGNGTILSSLDQKREYIDKIMQSKVAKETVNGRDIEVVDSEGVKIYKYTDTTTNTSYYFKYATKSFKDAETASDPNWFTKIFGATELSTLGDNKFSNFLMMWNKCEVRGYAKKSESDIECASVPMIMCEAPLLFAMFDGCKMNGVVYAPNPKSVFLCGSKGTLGTGSNDSNKLNGGSIVVGKVLGVSYNQAQWQFFEKDKFDVAEKLSDALLDSRGGIGDIQTEGGTESTPKWTAGGYE